MCSTHLSSSEKMGVLNVFLKWFLSRKRFRNHSAIANVNLPQNPGQKVETRKRKDGRNKPSNAKRHVVLVGPCPEGEGGTCLDQTFDTLFMTVAADTVALNMIFEGLLFMVLLIMMKK